MDERQEKDRELDLFVLLEDMLWEGARLWRMGILAVLICALGFLGYGRLTYRPVYEASASFTVRASDAQQTSYNSRTAEQLTKSYEQILLSDVLQSRVAENLSLMEIPEVQVASGTTSGIITLTVTSGEAEWAWEILTAMLDSCPEIAEYVVGPTQLYMLEESGVPELPAEPFRFRKAVITGTALGVLLWLAAAALRAFSRDTVRREQELPDLPGIECLSSVPVVKPAAGDRLPMLHRLRREQPFREPVRLLRLRVEKRMQQQNKKILLISSALPGEGKSTVAINLAISLAGKGKRVLLMDWNPDNPSVKGLLQPGEMENLFLLPWNSETAGNNDRTKNLLRKARAQFDYVLLDAPACTQWVEDAAELAECALLVVRQEDASLEQILEGWELLRECGVSVIGCVMNRVRRRIISGGNSGIGYAVHRKE